MSDKTMPYTGGCMCGAVRYEAMGEPLEVGHCHCHSCRRQTGAPVVTWVTFEADKVRFAGRTRSIHEASAGGGWAVGAFSAPGLGSVVMGTIAGRLGIGASTLFSGLLCSVLAILLAWRVYYTNPPESSDGSVDPAA